MRILSAFCLVVLAAAPLAANTPAAAPENDDDQIVCKNQAKTGTRFAKRVCRTRAHWEEMREQARRQAEEEFNRRTIETRRD